MPPDVMLLLASSGLTFVASLMFLVRDEVAPVEVDDPRLHVSFCLPPLRLQQGPPPLPIRPDCAVSLSTPGLHSVMTMRPADGDEWLVTLECVPVPDSAALQVRGNDGVGAVTDLRWHGKAGLARPTKRQWRQKPGRA
jgi:hypothetical protein